MLTRVLQGAGSVLLLTFNLTAAAAPREGAAEDGAAEDTVSAPPPVVIVATPQISIKGWKADRYNDYLVAISERVIAQTNALVSSWPLEADEAEIRQRMDALIALMEQARQEALALPPWKGDASFRDAVATGAAEVILMIQAYMEEGFPLCTRPEVVYADLQALERLTRNLQARAAQIDDGIHAVQRTFAEDNRYLLRPSPQPPPLTRPEFRTDTLPPPGSALSADMHVSFAVRYHNAMAARQNRALNIVNPTLQVIAPGNAARLPELAAATEQLQSLLQEVERMGSWGADDGLLAATRAQIQALIGLTGDTMPQIVALQEDQGAGGAVRRRDRAAHALLLDTLNKTLAATPLMWQSQATAFLDRQGVTAYTAWLKALPE